MSIERNLPPLVAGLAALWFTAAPAQDVLVINSFGGDYEKHHRELVIAPFQQQHGVEIKVVTAYSGDLLAQLRAQKAQPQFDVAHFSGGLETPAAAEGLLSPIEPGELANYDQMYDYAVAGLAKGIGPTYQTAVIGLLYDTEQIAAAPTSWRALADPAYAGRVLLTDAASNTYGLLGFLMINRVAGGTLDDIGPGLEFVDGILDNVTIVSKSPEIQQNFAQGNAWLAPYAQDYAYTLSKAGLPVAFTVPEEGAAVAPITVNLVAGRPNRELALKFIDFSIRAEASLGWAEALRYSPTNKTVELPPDVAAGVVHGEQAAARLVSFDAAKIGDQRAAWNERWTRMIAR